MIEVGKKYYFIQHAYHHFLGEVEAVEGPRRYRLKNVVRVQGCSRGWTEFFRDGFLRDTDYTVWPDGHIVDHPITETPWRHDIPKG